MISLLRKGNNGNQILGILEAIATNSDNIEQVQISQAQPTLEELTFWDVRVTNCGSLSNT